MTSLILASVFHLVAHRANVTAPLQEKVTVHQVDALVSEILKDLSKQTGTRLRIDFYEQDLKATVLVKDRPLSEILAGLASVLGARWTETDGTKILGLTPEERDDRKKFVALERKLEESEAIKTLESFGVPRSFYRNQGSDHSFNADTPIRAMVQTPFCPTWSPERAGLVEGWPFPLSWLSGRVNSPPATDRTLEWMPLELPEALNLPHHGLLTYNEKLEPLWIVPIGARYRPFYRDYEVGYKGDGTRAELEKYGLKLPGSE